MLFYIHANQVRSTLLHMSLIPCYDPRRRLRRGATPSVISLQEISDTVIYGVEVLAAGRKQCSYL